VFSRRFPHPQMVLLSIHDRKPKNGPNVLIVKQLAESGRSDLPASQGGFPGSLFRHFKRHFKCYFIAYFEHSFARYFIAYFISCFNFSFTRYNTRSWKRYSLRCNKRSFFRSIERSVESSFPTSFVGSFHRSFKGSFLGTFPRSFQRSNARFFERVFESSIAGFFERSGARFAPVARPASPHHLRDSRCRRIGPGNPGQATGSVLVSASTMSPRKDERPRRTSGPPVCHPRPSHFFYSARLAIVPKRAVEGCGLTRQEGLLH